MPFFITSIHLIIKFSKFKNLGLNRLTLALFVIYLNFIRRQIEEIIFFEFLWLTRERSMVVSPKLRLLGLKHTVKWGVKAIIVLALISAGGG